MATAITNSVMVMMANNKVIANNDNNSYGIKSLNTASK